MNLLTLSDQDIRDIATPILKDIVDGTNAKNWELFSKHMPEEEANNSSIRENIESQWEESDWLTSLNDSAEFLGVIRKSNAVIVLWKQTSHKASDEFLEKLVLVEVAGEIKQSGIWLE